MNNSHIQLCAARRIAADAGVSVRVATDACVGSTPENHRLALNTMALFAPLVELTDSATILA